MTCESKQGSDKHVHIGEMYKIRLPYWLVITILTNFFNLSLKKAYIYEKMLEKIIKNSLLTSDEFWQQEVGQLTSADVLYQMVGLCDYKNALLSHLQYI